jgi:hypothetical protein
MWNHGNQISHGPIDRIRKQGTYGRRSKARLAAVIVLSQAGRIRAVPAWRRSAWRWTAKEERGKEVIPVPKRPAAPSAGTRQNIRRDLFRTALRMVNQKFWREPRAARRKIARAHAKAQWKLQGINP